MMSPYLGYSMMLNPYLLPSGLLLTSAICGVSSLYAYMRPSGSLLWLRGPLMGGLFALIGL